MSGLDAYRNRIKEKEAQYGLPEGILDKVAFIESSYRTDAVSPVGAKGMFQFMPATAKEYGVEDPFDFEQSVDGAARFMKWILNKHGNNVPESLAYYNGGHKAVAALRQGQPWRETRDYLKKFFDGKGGQPYPSTATFRASDTLADPSVRLDMDNQKAVQYDGLMNDAKGFWKGIETGFKLENSVFNLIQQQALEKFDPNFRWSNELYSELTDGINPAYWDKILESGSEETARAISNRIRQAQDDMKEVANYGVGGYAGLFGGAMLDVDTLVALATPQKLALVNLMEKGKRLRNAAIAGGAAGLSNAAIEAASYQAKPLGQPEDIAYGALFGVALGGLGGSLYTPRKVATPEEDAVVRIAQTEAQKVFTVDPAKLARLDEDNARIMEAYRNKLYNDPALWGKSREETKFNVQEPIFFRGIQREPEVENISSSARVNINGPWNPEQNANELISSIVNVGRPLDEVFSFTSTGKLRGYNPNFSSPYKKFVTKGDLEAMGLSSKADLESVVARIKGGERDPVRFTGESLAARDVLSRVISESPDPYLRQVASVLQKKLDPEVKVRFLERDQFNKLGRGATNWLGVYNPRTHSVSMPSDGKTNYSTLTHELAHAATAWKLREAGNNPNTQVGKIAKELEDFYKELKTYAKANRLRVADNYYMSNIDEFIAGLFSGGPTNSSRSKEFIEFLSSYKVQGYKNALHWVVSKIKAVLGFSDNEMNALMKSLDLTSKLIDTRVDIDFAGKTKIRFERTSELIPEVDAKAAEDAGLSPVFGWGLGLENRLGGAKAPPSVRSLAAKLFGTTVGYKDHSVVQRNAWDDTVMLSESWQVQMMKPIEPAFMEFMSKNGYKAWEKGKAWEDFGEQVSKAVLGFNGDFSPEVLTAARSVQKTLDKVREHINNPSLHVGGVKKGLTQRDMLDANGNKVLSDPLESNPNYLPRRPDVQKWQALTAKYGREAIERWVAKSHQNARGISEEKANSFAKWYVRAVEEAKVNRTSELLDDMLRGFDQEGMIRSISHHLKVDEDYAKTIVEGIFPKKDDAGSLNGNLRHRNTLDEKYTERWIDKDGNEVTIGYHDIFVSNAFDAIGPYLRRQAGSVALAHHLDVYKNTDISTLIEKATTNKLGDNLIQPNELRGFRDDLQFTFDRILGVPQEEFTKLNKSLAMWRSFNVIRLMGGAVWNQVVEMGQIAGSLGFRATMGAVPELRKLRRDIRTGKAPNELLEHLENMTGGAGADFLKRLDFKETDDWVRNIGDSKNARFLDWLDNRTRKFASGVLNVTGMTGAMVQQKRIHAVALTNHFVRVANGMKSDFLTKERLAFLGMDLKDFEALKASIKQYSSPKKGEFKETFGVDFDKWAEENPKTYSMFALAIQRESRRVIQENDLASMVPIMGSTLGQTVFQFQNFTFQAWNKSLMYGIHNRDRAVVMSVLYASFFASLAYMGRTMLSAQGMSDLEKEEFLDKRMTPQQIIANSFGRISQASMLPTVYDTTIGTMTGTPLFSGLRTTSDLTSFASNPTLSALNSVISMQKLVRNAVSDEYQTTERDVRAWGRTVLPLGNVAPFSTMLNSFAAQFPSSENELD